MENLSKISASPALVAVPMGKDFSVWINCPDGTTVVNWKIPNECNYVDMTGTSNYIVRASKDDGTGLAPSILADETPVDGTAALLTPGFVAINYDDMWLSFRGFGGAAQIQLTCYK